MDEVTLNPLRIIEDDIPSNSDNNTDNSSNTVGETFDFSASDIEELDSYESQQSVHNIKTQKSRNSLLIIEDKDLVMDADEDFNNNNCESLHRLSLQVESGDSDSLVVTNEAVNRTIIQIRSNGIDFGDLNETNTQQQRLIREQTIHETINQEVNINDTVDLRNEDNEDEVSIPDNSDENDDTSGDQVIVNILGQINEIVGQMCI